MREGHSDKVMLKIIHGEVVGEGGAGRASRSKEGLNKGLEEQRWKPKGKMSRMKVMGR